MKLFAHHKPPAAPDDGHSMPDDDTLLRAIEQAGLSVCPEEDMLDLAHFLLETFGGRNAR